MITSSDPPSLACLKEFPMPWNFLVGYWLLSQVTVGGCIAFSWKVCEDFPLRDQFKEMSLRNRVWLLSIFGVLNCFLAPLLLPWLTWSLVSEYRRELTEARELQRTFKELVLDPLHECNIPKNLMEYIEEHTEAPIALGYENLGDYWLKHEPFNSKARLFLDADRTTFVEIGITLDTLYFEANSFLMDGTAIATASCHPFKQATKFAERHYHVNFVPDADMSELILAHTAALNKLAQEKNVEVCQIPRDDWQPYYRYHNQRYGQIRFELGEIDHPPRNSRFPAAPALTTAEDEKPNAEPDPEPTGQTELV